MVQLLWYDCTFENQCTAPVTLTFEGQLFLVNWLRPYATPSESFRTKLSSIGNITCPMFGIHISSLYEPIILIFSSILQQYLDNIHRRFSEIRNYLNTRNMEIEKS